MNELEQIKAKQAQIEQAQSELNQLIKEFEANKGKENGYTWEECFKGTGFFIHGESAIYGVSDMDKYDDNINVATTEKVCKSHLAACQLSHIIEQLNEDFGGNEKIIIYYDAINKKVRDLSGVSWALPYLKSYEAFNKLIETNTPLLKQYFGIDEKE